MIDLQKSKSNPSDTVDAQKESSRLHSLVVELRGKFASEAEAVGSESRYAKRRADQTQGAHAVRAVDRVPHRARVRSSSQVRVFYNCSELHCTSCRTVCARGRYLRGRQAYQHINTCIDEFNIAVTEKYKILATPKSKQGDATRKAIWEYKEQECKDTKGWCYYFTRRTVAITLHRVFRRSLLRGRVGSEALVTVQARQQRSRRAHHSASLQPHSRDPNQEPHSLRRQTLKLANSGIPHLCSVQIHPECFEDIRKRNLNLLCSF